MLDEETVEQVGIRVFELREIDEFLERGLFGPQLSETAIEMDIGPEVGRLEAMGDNGGTLWIMHVSRRDQIESYEHVRTIEDG